MKSSRIFIFSAFLFSAILIVGFTGHALAADCGCSAEPDGGWGPPDYTNDPSWGSSLDDLTGGGGSSGDASGGGSDTSGGADDSSSTDTSGSTSDDSGSGSSSSDSGTSSSPAGGSSEEGFIWRIKGDDLYEQGLYNESLDAYQKALKYDPYALKSWTGIGLVYLQLEEPVKAADAYKKAIRIDPGDAALYVLLGDAYAANESYDDAIANYQKAQAVNPRIIGVSEKIVIAKADQTAMSMTNTTPDAPEVSETTEPATPATELTNGTVTEPIQPETTPKAALPGVTAGISVLVTGLAFLLKRK
jgi:hypothetical protein